MVRFARFYRINGLGILFGVFVTSLSLKGRLFCLHFSTDYVTLQNIRQ